MSDICSQTQTPLLLGGRKELPVIFQRTDLAQGPVLLLSAGHWVSWATQSGCAPHIPDQGAQSDACTCCRETGMNTRKTNVWKNGLTSSQKDQLKPKQSIHASVTHHASTIGHIPVKNPTTMQSREMGNPKVCFDLWSSP